MRGAATQEDARGHPCKVLRHKRTPEGTHARAMVWFGISFWKTLSGVSLSPCTFLSTELPQEKLEGSAGAAESSSQKPQFCQQ